MARDRGPNNGITGTLVLDDGTTPFTVRVLGYDRILEGHTFDDTGRGDGDFGSTRVNRAGGTVLLVGEQIIKTKAEGDATQYPATWKGATGTIILREAGTDAAPLEETISVRIISHRQKRNEKGNGPNGEDIAKVFLSAVITGMPTQTGYAAADAGSDDKTAGDKKELYQGTSYTADDWNIQRAGTVQYIVYNATDTTDDDWTLLTDTLGDVDPPTTSNLVRRTATHQRIGRDVLITISFGMRSTKDDVEMEGTVYHDDPSDLASSAIVTKVEADDTPDGGVSVSGLSANDTTKKQINAQNWQIGYGFAKDTNQQKAEQETSYTLTDSESLSNTIALGKMDGSPTSPGGNYVVRTSKTDALTHDHFRTTSEHGLRTLAEDATFPNTFAATDPNDLDTTGKELQYYTTTDGEPSPASQPDNTKILSQKFSQHNRVKSTAEWQYGQRDSIDDRELPKTETFADAGTLSNTITLVKVDGTPTAPGGSYVLRGTKNRPLTQGLATNHSETEQEFGLRTPAEDETFPNTFARVDPNDLQTDGKETQFYTGTLAPSPASQPDNTKIVFAKTSQFNRIVSKAEWEFSQKDSADEALLPHIYTLTDSSTLTNEISLAALDASPSAPGGSYVLRETRSIPQTRGLSTNHVVTAQKFGLTTPAQDLEYKHSKARVEIDSGTLSVTASVVANSGDPVTFAGSILASNMGTKEVKAVEVIQITPSLALQMIEKDGGDKCFVGPWRNHTLETIVRGIPASAVTATSPPTIDPGSVSFADTEAYQLIKFNGGDLIAMGIPIRRARGRFTWRRIYSIDTTGTPEWDTYMYFALQAQVNNATFLGQAEGEVMYVGPSAAYSFLYSGARRLMVDYDFEYDRWKWFGDGFLAIGHVAVNSGSILATGLYHASTLEAGFVCDFPAEGDFSGFTT